MSEKFTVTVSSDGTVFLQGDQGSTMNINGGTTSVSTTGNATSGSILTMHQPYVINAPPEEEASEVVPIIVEALEGMWWCEDCAVWLEGPPEEWTQYLVECYYEGPEEDFDIDDYVSRNYYLKGDCGCEFEDADSGGCFLERPQGSLVWKCPRCENLWPEKDQAQSCEESCRLYG